MLPATVMVLVANVQAADIYTVVVPDRLIRTVGVGKPMACPTAGAMARL